MIRKFMVVIIAMLTPILYHYLLSTSAIYVQFPLMHKYSIKSIFVIAMIYIATDVICAILTALTIALPCGYLLRAKPNILIGLLLMLILGFPLGVFLVEADFNILSVIDITGQCIAVFFSVYYFVHYGYQLAQSEDKC